MHFSSTFFFRTSIWILLFALCLNGHSASCHTLMIISPFLFHLTVLPLCFNSFHFVFLLLAFRFLLIFVFPLFFFIRADVFFPSFSRSPLFSFSLFSSFDVFHDFLFSSCLNLCKNPLSKVLLNYF